ncbi:MAG: hybrid sensor histidine kinase/response regulator [Anaerolineae bacterium]|nr:hybrid sensor histidine kinase/response regulator [Anaerolineae bacterium]
MKDSSFALQHELVATILDLRHGILRGFLWATAIAHMLWYYYVISTDYRFYFHTVVILMVWLILFAIYKLYRQRYLLAVYLLLGIIALWQILIVLRFPYAVTLCLGVLGIIAANALGGARVALGTLGVLWLSGLGACRASLGEFPSPGVAAGVLGLYLLVWAASWLANRPMRASVEWAISGWARAREALKEVQSRRGELYRALRALEEATYRIERMNRELIAARQEAETARAQKARFTAMVSHELRGPLNLILGFSHLIVHAPERYGSPLPSAYVKDIESIHRNAQHLAALVDDILDLARIEAAKLPLSRDRVDLKDVVQRTFQIVQPLAERKGLYLRQEAEGSLPWIIADPVRLRQALLNLLVNAIRVTEKGGITVQISPRPDSLLVSVRDTGPGIPPEELPNLFRPFSQLSTSKSSGSGLGLNISKELIELHGGKIWVESEVGKGTTFYFTVPLPGTHAQSRELVKIEKRFDLAQRLENCLVVHDDPNLVRLLARYLEEFHVIGLPNTERLNDYVLKFYPRAILTSLDLAEQIFHSLKLSRMDVPVVGFRPPQASQNLNLPGVLGYLVKPILPEALESFVKQVECNGETTVLIIDDEPDAVRLLSNMLLNIPRPYRLLQAYSGKEALAQMQKVKPDIVFLDLVMPGMSGIQLLRRMRLHKRLAQVPVVIVSARDWMENKIALNPPFVLYAQKPVEIGRAIRGLSALLGIFKPTFLITD